MYQRDPTKAWHFEAGYVHLRDIIEAAAKYGPQRIMEGGREFSLTLVQGAPAPTGQESQSSRELLDDGLDALLAPRRGIGA